MTHPTLAQVRRSLFLHAGLDLPRHWKTQLFADMSDQADCAGLLDAPVIRVGGENVPIPFSKSLEPLVLPDPPRLAATVAALVHGH
jgi:pyruvate/2-oxoglutarate/acetoin dehydrogenase E1 component